jgi:glutamyl-tRNA synthetase
VQQLVGRLAPSPTGVLHLGNARSFLLAWLSVRSRQGVLRLRIEDIDGPRVKAGAEQQALEDLAWLGLDHDGVIIHQSERLQLYRKAVDSLLASGKAYPCVCTRQEVEAAASAPQKDWLDAPPYPGTCRDRFDSVAAARAQTGRDPAIRFLVEPEQVPFQDIFLGPQEGRILGDFVIERRQRGAAYQLAVVVDDADNEITEVLRGDDLLPSTPRQLLLYQALELTPPQFAHVPLVVGEDGLRLAKRHGDTSLRHIRKQGITAEEVVGYLAWLCGFRPKGTRCLPRDLLEDFDLQELRRGPVVGTDHGFPL